MKHFQIKLLIGMALLLAGASRLQAQWTSQELKLAPGWNGVYLHVAPHESTMLDVLNIYPEIQEIWLWRPEVSTQQFIENPEQPTGASSRWLSWKRSEGVGSKLQTLIGNAAYLVRTSDPLPDGNMEYSWVVKGRPLPPRYQWTTSGLNFIGMSTPKVNPPSFESFFQLSPESAQGMRIYDYDDGNLNPTELRALRSAKVTRGQAVWLRRSGKRFNNYFGPFELDLPNATKGLEFGEENGKFRIHLRNVSTEELTVRAQLLASEDPPDGETPIVDRPPLILRGDLGGENFAHSYDDSLTQLGGELSWTLKPFNEDGSAAEIILGVNRFAMDEQPGSLYAGILRFTDSKGHLQVDIPVSAIKESRVGLWIGEASINQVRHNLIQKVLDPTKDEEGSIEKVLVDENIDDAIEPVERQFSRDTTFGDVARPFPLRLILHQTDNGDIRLLQRVYLGLGKDGEGFSETVLATEEEFLDPDNLDIARRITAPHLPRTNPVETWTPRGNNPSWDSGLSFEVNLAFDNQESNPFLHAYHPDHDNKDPEFKTYDSNMVGMESYTVTRSIDLNLDVWSDDFDAVTRGGGQIIGFYSEELRFTTKNSQSKAYDVEGRFVLNRIISIGSLTSGSSSNNPPSP
jgi:hypothetical protein